MASGGASVGVIRAARAAIELFLEDKTQRGLNASFRRLQRFGASVRNLGQQLALASAPPVLGLAAAVREFASQEQILGRFQSVFQGLASNADQFATALSGNVNQSVIQVRDNLATFQSILRGFGLQADVSLPIAKALAAAAEDVVAFDDNVRGSQEAVRRLVSGISGEIEAVRRFGADVRKASVEQEIFATGIARSEQEIGGLELTLGRVNIILRALAQGGVTGQAAREVNTLKSQFRGLAADIRDTAGAIGRALAPATAQIVQPIRAFIRSIGRLTTVSPGIAKSIGAIAIAVPALAGTLIAAGTAISGFAVVLGTASTALTAFVTAATAAPIGVGLAAAVTAGAVAFGNFSQAARQAAGTIRVEFDLAFKALREFFIQGELEALFELAGNIAKSGFLRGFGGFIDEARFSLIRGLGELAIETNPLLSNQPRAARDAVLDRFVKALRDQTEKQFRGSLLDLQARRIELINRAQDLANQRARRERQRPGLPQTIQSRARQILPDEAVVEARQKIAELGDSLEKAFNPEAAFRARIAEIELVARRLSPRALRNAIADAEQQFRDSALKFDTEGVAEKIRSSLDGFVSQAQGAFGGRAANRLFAEERRFNVQKQTLEEQKRTTKVLQDVDGTIKRLQLRYR